MGGDSFINIICPITLVVLKGVLILPVLYSVYLKIFGIGSIWKHR